MESGLQRLTAQADALADQGISLSSAAASYRAAHGTHGVSLTSVQLHALARHSAWLARYARARVRRDAAGIVYAQAALARHAAVLDRTRPLAKAARPGVDALLLRASRARAEADGVLPGEAPRARPDPGNMVLEEDEEEEGGSGGEEVYRPPKMAEVVYDGEVEAVQAREDKLRAKMAARAARSRSVKEMLDEVSGRPEVVREDVVDEEAYGGRELAQLKKVEEERIRYEEENFTRLNVTREDKKRRRALATAQERSALGDDPSGDQFADIMGVADRVLGKGKAGDARRKAGQERHDAMDAIDMGFSGGKAQKRRASSGSGKKRRHR